MTLTELYRRVVALTRRRQLTRDLDEEIAGHLADAQREYEDDGVTAEEARRRARIRVGGARAIEESGSDVWRFVAVEAWLRDLRLGARALRRQPVFSLAAVATFALGIGAATAIFSVAYGVAFRPLPYPNADRLVRIYEANTATNETKLQVSQGTFQGWRESVSSLESLSLFGRPSVSYTRGDSPQPLTTVGVSPRFFDVLGVAPLIGRTFGPDADYTRMVANDVVLAYDAWQRLFGGNAAIVDTPLQLSERGQALRIIGVMPRGFAFDAPVDAWRLTIVEVPVARVVRSWRYDGAIGRLRPGRTLDQLRAELALASAHLARDFPATNRGWATTVERLRDAIIGAFGRASWLLLATVAGVLLVACANVAGLLTARAMGRTRETSIRVALGAGAWRLVQLWLTEAFVLASTGAVLGVALAWWLVRLLRAAAPPGLPRVNDIAIDWPVLGIACAATAISAVVCALVPVVGLRSRALPAGLSAGTTRAGDTPARRRISAALVALQSGAALALVVLSVVFARSFVRLTSVDLGWRPQHVLSMQVAPKWPAENRRPWFLYAQWAEQLVARLDATPGVAHAAITTDIPFSPERYPAEIARGRDPIPEERRWPIALHIITPGYLETMGVTLRQGRAFTRDDRFDEAMLTTHSNMGGGVAMVSESTARALWPGQPAIGQQFRVPANDGATFREVVGVVADVQFAAVGDEPSLDVFLPWLQNPTGNPRLVVRATGDAATIAPAVRAAVLSEYSATGIDRVMPVESLVDRALAPARLTSQLIAALGGLALVLAGVGVYGSLSTLVTARAREIAVRMALGASPLRMLWRTVGQGLWPVALGTAAGFGVAAVVISSIRSLLFGVDRIDLESLAIGAAIVGAVTMLACLAPAMRAARTEAISVLKTE